ncbi:lanthionine synthetase LanC family protein [Hymenobacter cellulosivorans]|uniref:Lanthionine synthetase n=1 Tax=Hymenobacter cellulosivorans TaxID=2932249 RepID=A0ABY4F7D9_9BACT|nr:lanthionine synthetase LanC family protein [Hymenobacter cellulosivorans]UOQ52369.1 hypothetical protein MUN80_21755 [Hymenobacter cellulosivorans]
MNNLFVKQFEFNQTVIESRSPEHDSLLDGNLSLCYYYAFLYKMTNVEKYRDAAFRLIEEVFNAINKNEARLYGSSYASGIAGFAYTTTIVNEILDLGIDLHDELFDLDGYLMESLMLDLKSDKLDCLHSGFGIVHYFITRTNKNSNDVIKAICNKAKITSEGLWFENIVESESKDRNVANLSTAHGLTGMLLILLNSLEYTEHKLLVEETIKEGVRFILNNSIANKPSNERGNFYSKINFNNNTFEMYPRLAWCYGDLGVIVLLYKCHAYFNNADYKTIADRAGLSTINNRSKELSWVDDPFFCHGSSGVSMMYKVLYKYSNIPQYKESQQFWINKTLDFFKNINTSHDIYQKKHSTIDGLLGVNLSIASNLNDSNDDWLSMFFL